MSGVEPFDWRAVGAGHLGRLLMRALRRVQVDSLAELAQRGHTEVRPGHLPVFSNVDPGGTRITELAARAEMTRQMMGRLVGELTALGYATSTPDPTDQRAIVVTLTDRGWSFCHDARDVIAALERRYATLLGTETLEPLKSALTRLSH